jgi:hypothetical protein
MIAGFGKNGGEIFAGSTDGKEEYVGPRVVKSASECNAPPSDAIILFDGKDFKEWQSVGGGDVKWRIDGNAMTVT